MKKIQKYLFLIFVSTVSISYAQRGKDGNETINTANYIVNEYTSLTADAGIGATSISVSSSGLNTNNRFPGNLAAGDLIMIIQMQGATISGQPDTAVPTVSDPNDVSWGSITNYNNCGNYELCQVAAVPDAFTITIDCGLVNDYTASGKVQVIRMPRYNTLTITSPGVLTCQSWNSSTGGVLAIEVNGNTTINSGGKINTTGKGFRGAALFTPLQPRSQTLWYSSSSLEVSANKGEGIAGYDNDYTIYGGKFCRGAAANAGGGGNVWNSGGGGGANAGSIISWTGQGTPDTSIAGWATAWNLESPGFAHTSSSGGGRGGYSFSGSDEDATVDPPSSLVWGGYAREVNGGLGGRPLDYSSGKIFMGGGGGGGEQDNNQGGAGGAGGGIIYFISYGTISGSGNDSILADGSNGGNSFTTPPLTSYSGKDGAGGGGGGGTILLNTYNVNGLILTAKGGKGGNQILTSGSLYFGAKNEAEGPGGGGGGGYIALSSGSATQLVNGGNNGTTNSDGLTEFPPNGATKGGAGLADQVIPGIDTILAANISVCSGDSAVLTATINGTIPATVTWYNAETGGTIIGIDTLITPPLSTTTTYYAGLCPGTYRIPVVVTVLPANASLTISQNPAGIICQGTSVTFIATPANEGTAPVFNWQVNGINEGTDSAVFSSSGLMNGDTVTCVLTPTSGCASGIAATSNAIIIAISPSITASVDITASSSFPICTGTTTTFTAIPVNGGTDPVFQWQINGINVGSDTAIFTSSSLTDGDEVTCVLTSNADCIVGSTVISDSIIVALFVLPTPDFTSNITSGCAPLCIQFTETNATNCNSVEYTFGDGESATLFSPQHCYTQAGTYSVTIFCTDTNNCTGSFLISNMINVSAQPNADFSHQPTDVITANTTVSFTNISSNSNSYSWNFDDPLSGVNDSSSLSSPSHTYTKAGTYCIELLAQNQAGCTDTINNCIVVMNDPAIVIPNMFTPNGDGNNDIFYIATTSVNELNCIIYDRWGLKIKEWNTVDGGWDGRTKSGNIAQDGVYFYIVKAIDMNGKIINEKGFLQLVKEK